MSELIKNKWGVVLAVLALLVLLVFLWPEQTEQNTPSPTPRTPEPVETKKPAPSISSTENMQQSVAISNPPPAMEDDNEKPVEETPEPEEEAEEPANQNYILCEHIVSGESQYEFTGQIRLINKGTKPVYGWSVNWEYDDGSTIIEASDVALSGNNPYTGEYLGWNAEIPPGETVTFSFTGIKGGDSAPKRVNVTGKLCM